MRDAAMAWIAYAVENGPPKYGPVQIPFLGQLKAVTGSGKTPVLAQVVSGLGDAVVLWTTRSSAVVEQTFANLNGRYHSLLPAKVKILRDIPSQIVWRDLIDSAEGLTIWVLTVASWNEADADTNGSADHVFGCAASSRIGRAKARPGSNFATSWRARCGSSPTKVTTKARSSLTNSPRCNPRDSSWLRQRRS